MAVKTRTTTESALVNEIIHALYAHAQLYRINTGSVKTATGYTFSTGTPKGFPDLAGYRRSDGRAVYIECKVHPNRPTPEQLEFIEKARAAGCIAGVCYSAADALELING